MGDHFVLMMDHLLTESTLDATIESGGQSLAGHKEAMVGKSESDFALPKMNEDEGLSGLKLFECRICQDEDLDSNMETPCPCCGSLKYAHRRCVQRWCNEKGNTMCEICLQQFKPGYTSPHPLFQYGSIPMDFRGHNSRFIAMLATNRSLEDADYDSYSASSTRSTLCCRSVAVIFMVLLIMRHILPLIISAEDEYSLADITLLLLSIAAVVLPICVMAQALTALHFRRRQQEEQELSIMRSEGENERLPQVQSQPPHLIQIH